MLTLLAIALGGLWRRWLGSERIFFRRSWKVMTAAVVFPILFYFIANPVTWLHFAFVGYMVAGPLVRSVIGLQDWTDLSKTPVNFYLYGSLFSFGWLMFTLYLYGLSPSMIDVTQAVAGAMVIPFLYFCAGYAWIFFSEIVGFKKYTLWAEAASGAFLWGTSAVLLNIFPLS